jgi:glycosyltransferase involved in cell wall biosynthesis
MRHILLATVEKPHDPKSWSGTPYNILKALESKFDKVSVLSSPVPKKNLLDSLLRIVLGRNKYPLWMTKYALKAYAKVFDETLSQHQPDAVLCISSQHLVFARKHKLPILMISDAPWIAYKEAYQQYESMPLLAKQYAKYESIAANNVNGVIYPSPWACEQAKQIFDLDVNKVHLIPFGANRHCSVSDEDVFQHIKNKNLGQLNFLFIGKDWDRKGGPLALSIIRKIIEAGYSASLDIVGCHPILETSDLEFSVMHGYLSPDDLEDSLLINNLFMRADFFIVPSYAECYGLVFAEAQSYGIPCITLDSQGISGVVDHGKTGLIFSRDDNAQFIAEKVIQLLKHKTAYLEMAVAARVKFSKELNWNSFSTALHEILVENLKK